MSKDIDLKTAKGVLVPEKRFLELLRIEQSAEDARQTACAAFTTIILGLKKEMSSEKLEKIFTDANVSIRFSDGQHIIGHGWNVYEFKTKP